jgi:hypothetical protein
MASYFSGLALLIFIFQICVPLGVITSLTVRDWYRKWTTTAIGGGL